MIPPGLAFGFSQNRITVLNQGIIGRDTGDILESKCVFSYVSVSSRSDASDNFRADGSDPTIAICRACAQEFVDGGARNRQAHRYLIQKIHRYNPYSRDCLGNIFCLKGWGVWGRSPPQRRNSSEVCPALLLDQRMQQT